LPLRAQKSTEHGAGRRRAGTPVAILSIFCRKRNVTISQHFWWCEACVLPTAQTTNTNAVLINKKKQMLRKSSGFIGNMLLFGSVIRSFSAGLLSENKIGSHDNSSRFAIFFMSRRAQGTSP
jgi:hypothetical protein